MTYIQPKPARRGRIIPRSRFNYDEDGIRRAQITGGDGVFITQGRDGTSVTVANDTDGSFWIRLVGGDGAGKYAWQKIKPIILGDGTVGWQDIPGFGTLAADPAYEANGVGRLPVGLRIQVEREAVTGQIRFQMDVCP